MTHPAARLSLIVCILGTLTGCASAPEPDEATDEEMPSWVQETPAEPKRPEYHDATDAETVDRSTSQQLAEAVCGSSPDARTCRKRMTRSITVYRGAFSEPGVTEMVVVAGTDAVLVRKGDSGLRRASTLEDVDVEDCLIANPNGQQQSLLCRIPTRREDGYAVEIAEVAVDDEGALVLTTLDVPRASDLDAVLFAGWKRSESGIEVRVHDAQKVRGTKVVDMSGQSCQHESFTFDQASGQLQPRAACTTGATRSQGTESDTSYEGRLNDPMMKHNRKYVMCYRRELNRLEEAIAQREKHVRMCEAGTAPEGVDCETLQSDEKSASDAAQDDADETDSEPLRDPADVRGQIQTRIVIGSPGAPVACEVVESDIGSERIEQCLCRELMKTDFPPVPKGSFFDVTYPFDFSPDLAR